jgi:chorismate mutase
MLKCDPMDLSASRAEIDRLDIEIIELLKKRFRKAGQIGKEKKAHKLKIEDWERDREVLKNYKTAARGQLDERFIEELVELILRYSKEVQKS